MTRGHWKKTAPRNPGIYWRAERDGEDSWRVRMVIEEDGDPEEGEWFEFRWWSVPVLGVAIPKAPGHGDGGCREP